MKIVQTNIKNSLNESPQLTPQELYEGYQTWREENLGEWKDYTEEELLQMAKTGGGQTTTGETPTGRLVYGEGEEELSFDDFADLLTTEKDFNPLFSDISIQEGDLEGMISIMQAFQQAPHNMLSFEDFQGTSKIEDVKQQSARDRSEAFGSYIPSEIVSRYGDLAGSGTSSDIS